MEHIITRQKRPSDDLTRLFCVPEPAWMIQPTQPFKFFNIQKPTFYLINGRPMAFAGEVA